MNLALLAKLGWKIVCGEECLWTKVMKTKYLRNKTFFGHKLRKGSSWVWKGIMKTRKIIRQGSCFQIGDRSAIDFWKDPWLPSLDLKSPTSKDGVDAPSWRRVFKLWDESTWQWKEPKIRQMCSLELVEAILKTFLASCML